MAGLEWLYNIDHLFNLGGMFFYRQFYPALQGHLINGASNAVSFQFYPYLGLIINGYKGDITPVAL